METVWVKRKKKDLVDYLDFYLINALVRLFEILFLIIFVSTSLRLSVMSVIECIALQHRDYTLSTEIGAALSFCLFFRCHVA